MKIPVLVCTDTSICRSQQGLFSDSPITTIERIGDVSRILPKSTYIWKCRQTSDRATPARPGLLHRDAVFSYIPFKSISIYSRSKNLSLSVEVSLKDNDFRVAIQFSKLLKHTVFGIVYEN